MNLSCFIFSADYLVSLCFCLCNVFLYDFVLTTFFAVHVLIIRPV